MWDFLCSLYVYRSWLPLCIPTCAQFLNLRLFPRDSNCNVLDYAASITIIVNKITIWMVTCIITGLNLSFETLPRIMKKAIFNLMIISCSVGFALLLAWLTKIKHKITAAIIILYLNFVRNCKKINFLFNFFLKWESLNNDKL